MRAIRLSFIVVKMVFWACQTPCICGVLGGGRVPLQQIFPDQLLDGGKRDLTSEGDASLDWSNIKKDWGTIKKDWITIKNIYAEYAEDGLSFDEGSLLYVVHHFIAKASVADANSHCVKDKIKVGITFQEVKLVGSLLKSFDSMKDISEDLSKFKREDIIGMLHLILADIRYDIRLLYECDNSKFMQELDREKILSFLFLKRKLLAVFKVASDIKDPQVIEERYSGNYPVEWSTVRLYYDILFGYDMGERDATILSARAAYINKLHCPIKKLVPTRAAHDPVDRKGGGLERPILEGPILERPSWDIFDFSIRVHELAHVYRLWDRLKLDSGLKNLLKSYSAEDIIGGLHLLVAKVNLDLFSILSESRFVKTLKRRKPPIDISNLETSILSLLDYNLDLLGDSADGRYYEQFRRYLTAHFELFRLPKEIKSQIRSSWPGVLQDNPCNGAVEQGATPESVKGSDTGEYHDTGEYEPTINEGKRLPSMPKLLPLIIPRLLPLSQAI